MARLLIADWIDLDLAILKAVVERPVWPFARLVGRARNHIKGVAHHAGHAFGRWECPLGLLQGSIRVIDDLSASGVRAKAGHRERREESRTCQQAFHSIIPFTQFLNVLNLNGNCPLASPQHDTRLVERSAYFSFGNRFRSSTLQW
jgi:hypothetical protein